MQVTGLPAFQIQTRFNATAMHYAISLQKLMSLIDPIPTHRRVAQPAFQSLNFAGAGRISTLSCSLSSKDASGYAISVSWPMRLLSLSRFLPARVGPAGFLHYPSFVLGLALILLPITGPLQQAESIRSFAFCLWG